MRMLGIYNSTNKRFRHDGDEFAREAFAWRAAQAVNETTDWTWVTDVRDGRVRDKIRRMENGLDVLAIFDHGTPRGLPRMRESYKNVKGLAQTIAGVTDWITIILYACSCGRGWWWRQPQNKRDIEVETWRENYSPRDGYAVALACELHKAGVDVNIFAHLTAGHTTRNPHVVEVTQLAGDVARKRVVTPGTPEWKQWKADMRGPLRFTFWK